MDPDGEASHARGDAVRRQGTAPGGARPGGVHGVPGQIRSLRDEVAGLRHDFDHRQELGRVDALEVRVSAIESRLGVPSR